jgi:hypothetical protein
VETGNHRWGKRQEIRVIRPLSVKTLLMHSNRDATMIE